MMHGRRTAAMAVACLLCMAVVALLLARGVESRKLLWTGQEEQNPGSLGSSHGAAGTAATPEPCSGGGARGSAAAEGSRGSAGTGEARCETEARWAEMHTDYIYTQDVKHP